MESGSLKARVAGRSLRYGQDEATRSLPVAALETPLGIDQS